MGASSHRIEGARAASPYRLVVVTALAAFWATLLLALGVPGAGVILVAALGGGAAAGLRILLAHRAWSPPRIGVPVRPAFAWVRTLAARVRTQARLPRAMRRRPEVPRQLVARGRVALGALGAAAERRAVRARRPRSPHSEPAFDGGRAGEAWRFCRLGAQLRQQGRLAAAVESFETAIWIFRDLDDPRGLALALNGLGLALVRQRRLDTAVARYQEAAEILGRLGDEHAHGQVLANLGTALRSQGRSDEARASWEDALARLEPGSAEAERTGRELQAV